MFYQSHYTIRELLESGVHYGHRKNFWNPKMSPYIYGVKNSIHIIDLQQTAVLLEKALLAMKDVAAKHGKILFVCTKKQASPVIAEHAKRCGQYYVNHRWLGGTLTNWSTVSASIKTLVEYENALSDEQSILNKKERLDLTRKRDKLENVLGGIRNMGGVPNMLFVIGVKDNIIAIKEAQKLKIPTIAIVDTNCDPSEIDYIIPGNDDATKAIALYANLAAEAVLCGLSESLSRSGVDIGSSVSTELEDAAMDIPENLEHEIDINNVSSDSATDMKENSEDNNEGKE